MIATEAQISAVALRVAMGFPWRWKGADEAKATTLADCELRQDGRGETSAREEGKR